MSQSCRARRVLCMSVVRDCLLTSETKPAPSSRARVEDQPHHHGMFTLSFMTSHLVGVTDGRGRCDFRTGLRREHKQREEARP